MAANQKLPEAALAVGEQASALDSRYGRLEPELIIELRSTGFFPNRSRPFRLLAPILRYCCT